MELQAGAPLFFPRDNPPIPIVVAGDNDDDADFIVPDDYHTDAELDFEEDEEELFNDSDED